ncbi:MULTISPECIES: DUF2487 family protein [Exiguobacterium]|uniref:DUF2487 domain-containing protein n=2 Tax=Exiguobacterium TaxID=33986 RepID=U1MXI3_9BACL|nr:MULTISPECIES: DUF2487 family protein [Exiguobacterium]ERG66581.1 hypothetical protein M467_04735 [Exiguobacterium chiriqhucha RW-2]MDL5375956.1 DUF2487 family protein [Exiguobacterium mexicanum]TCI73982.1 DUF2487 family protein [Exiguobacterium sp. IPCI3]TCI83139.1 DUF2487 family protein [Exiguobacterium sp. IPCH1]TCI84193.1 DUF2487 family protein [Exiguobacterium sp. IPBC4]
MRFDGLDAMKSLSERQYVDTLVVPLVELAFDEDMVRKAEGNEVIQAVALETERQLSGRTMLSPTISYVDAEAGRALAEQVTVQATASGFTHVLFISSDLRFKGSELPIIFVPPLALKGMSGEQSHTMVQNFATQVITDLSSRWMAT